MVTLKSRNFFSRMKMLAVVMAVLMGALVSIPAASLANSSIRGEVFEVSFQIGEAACKTVPLSVPENGGPAFISADEMPTEDEIAAAEPEGQVVAWIELQDELQELAGAGFSDSAASGGSKNDSDLLGDDNTDEPSPCVEYSADLELIASGAYVDITTFAVTGDVVFLAVGVPDGDGFSGSAASDGPKNDSEDGDAGDGDGFSGSAASGGPKNDSEELPLINAAAAIAPLGLGGSVGYRVGNGVWIDDGNAAIPLIAENTTISVRATFPGGVHNKQLRVEFGPGAYPLSLPGFIGTPPGFTKNAAGMGEYGGMFTDAVWTRSADSMLTCKTYGGVVTYDVDDSIVGTKTLSFAVSPEQVFFSDTNTNELPIVKVSILYSEDGIAPPAEAANSILNAAHTFATSVTGSFSPTFIADVSEYKVGFLFPSYGAGERNGRVFDKIVFRVNVPAGIDIAAVGGYALTNAGSVTLTHGVGYADIEMTNVLVSGFSSGLSLTFAGSPAMEAGTYSFSCDTANSYALPKGAADPDGRIAASLSGTVKVVKLNLAGDNIADYIYYQGLSQYHNTATGAAADISPGRFGILKAANTPVKTNQIVTYTSDPDFRTILIRSDMAASSTMKNGVTDADLGISTSSGGYVSYKDLSAVVAKRAPTGEIISTRTVTDPGSTTRQDLVRRGANTLIVPVSLADDEDLLSMTFTIPTLGNPSNPAAAASAGFFVHGFRTAYTPGLTGDVVTGYLEVRDGEQEGEDDQLILSGHQKYRFLGADAPLNIRFGGASSGIVIERLAADGTVSTGGTPGKVYAGSTVRVQHSFGMKMEPNTNVSTLRGFHIFVRTMPGITIDPASFKVYDSFSEAPIPYEVVGPYVDSTGALVYELANTDFTYSGNFFTSNPSVADPFRYTYLWVSYLGAVSRSVSGAVSGSAYAAMMPDGLLPDIPIESPNITWTMGNGLSMVSDTTGFTNGKYTKYLRAAAAGNFTYDTPFTRPLYQRTSFSADGGGTWSTAVTPARVLPSSTELLMRVDSKNESISPVERAATYINIPKQGQSFDASKNSGTVSAFFNGSHLQVAAAAFSATLAEAMTDIPADCTVFYSSSYITNTTQDASATWYTAADLGGDIALADVKTVKVVHAGSGIAADEEESYTIKLNLPDKETLHALAGKTEIIAGAAYYDRGEGEGSGTMIGDPGAILFATGDISGKVFYDDNNNGVLDGSEGARADLAGVVVKAYAYSYNGAYIGNEAYKRGECTVGADGEFLISGLTGAVNLIFSKPDSLSAYGFTDTAAGAYTETKTIILGTLTAGHSAGKNAGMITRRLVTFDCGTAPGAGYVNIAMDMTAMVPATTPAYQLTAAATAGFSNNLKNPANYHFAGWSVTDNGLTPAAPDVFPYAITEDVTFYPVWEGNAQTLLFDKNSSVAAAGTLSKSVTFGAAAGTLPDIGSGAPTRTGYTFQGWSTASGNANSVNFSSANVVNWAGSKTVYAVWTQKSYTVNYDTNGGAPASIAAKPGVHWDDAGLLPAAAPTRAGWTFAGWDVTAGGTASPATNVQASAKYSELALDDATAAITLTAQWTEKSYTVNYDTNGGAPASIAAKTGVKWTDTNLLPASNPTKSGYNFAGWNVSVGGTAAGVANLKAYGELAASDTALAITLQAQWTEQGDYIVNYDTNGGMPAAIASKTGVKWTDAGLLPASGNPTRTGWTFAGWDVTAGGTASPATDVSAAAKYSELALDDATAAITLQAQWVQKSYTVNYDTNGGAPASIAAKPGVKWTDAGLLPASGNPTRTGWTFAGWDVTAGGSASDGTGKAGVLAGDRYADLAKNDVTGAITLRAQWTQIDYTVRYLPGAHGTFGTFTLGGLHYGDTTPAAPAATGAAGWRFTGWAPARGLAVTGDIDYTAQWVLNTYSIYYHGNGHTSGSEPAAVTLNHGAVWTVSEAGSLARTGYAFAGWAASASASAAAYSPGAANTLTGDVHLYAVWTMNTSTTETDTDLEPAPNTPQSAALIAEGFTRRDVERIEAQTGNPLTDLLGSNVPLGNGKSSAVWSLLSMILAIIAAIITAVLLIEIFTRRRYESEMSGLGGSGDGGGREEAERKRRRGRLLKALACVFGALTLIVWLLLDDTNLPMAWFNRYTLVVVVLFVVHLALSVLYRAGRGGQDRNADADADGKVA